MRRPDGHWIYWNVRRDSWDYHPYGPPVVSIPTTTPAPRPATGGRAHGPVGSPPAPAPSPPAPPPSPPVTQPPPPTSTPPAPAAGPAPAREAAQWPDPMPRAYPPTPFVPAPPKRKPAPVWAAGTPVVFADWWRRSVALVVDLLVTSGPTFLVLAIIDAAMVPGSLDPFSNQIDTTTRSVAMMVALALCYFVFFSAYFALSNGGETGATLGKRLMKIRVADQYDGTPVGPGRAFLRWILMGVFWVLVYIPGLVNLLWPLWDPQRQSWHDKLANSVVVTAPR